MEGKRSPQTCLGLRGLALGKESTVFSLNIAVQAEICYLRRGRLDEIARKMAVWRVEEIRKVARVLRGGGLRAWRIPYLPEYCGPDRYLESMAFSSGSGARKTLWDSSNKVGNVKGQCGGWKKSVNSFEGFGGCLVYLNIAVHVPSLN